MAARFIDVSESEIDQFKENAGVKLFKGRLIKFRFCKLHNFLKSGMFVYFFGFKVSATFSRNFCEIICSTEWFQQPQEFTNEIENMEVDELNKCLAKFYVSVRKTDGSYYKKTGLLSVRAALDRHLKAPKSLKNISFLFYFLK